MKKILIGFLMMLSIFGGFTLIALAAGSAGSTGGYSIDLNDVNPLGNVNLQDLIDRVANWALGLLIAMSVLFAIYAAYLFMFAGTNPGNVQTAKNIILYTVVAIIVALMARVMLIVVTDVLKGGSGSVGAALPSDYYDVAGMRPSVNSDGR